MKRKKDIILLVFIVVLLILCLYDKFALTSIRQTDFQINPFTMFCGYVGRPLLYLLIGILATSLLAGFLPLNRCRRYLWKILLLCGIVLLALYAGVLFGHLWLPGETMSYTLAGFLMRLLNLPALFLIPGILIEISIDGLSQEKG